MQPFPVICRVSQNHRETECGCNIRSSKNPLMTINRKVQGCRVLLSPGCHSLIEFEHHPRVKILPRDHKGFQRVALYKAHGVPELEKGCKGWEVIIVLIVKALITTVNITFNWATVK